MENFIPIRRIAVPVAFADDLLAAFKGQGVPDPIITVKARQIFLFQPGDERIASLGQQGRPLDIMDRLGELEGIGHPVPQDVLKKKRR